MGTPPPLPVPTLAAVTFPVPLHLGQVTIFVLGPPPLDVPTKPRLPLGPLPVLDLAPALLPLPPGPLPVLEAPLAAIIFSYDFLFSLLSISALSSGC